MDRRGFVLTRVDRSKIEASASPAGRGFGLMARGPGRIPCRIARPEGVGFPATQWGLSRRFDPLPHVRQLPIRDKADIGPVSRCQRLHRRTGSCRRALGLERYDYRPTRSLLHQPLVMISLRCSGPAQDTMGLEVGG